MAVSMDSTLTADERWYLEIVMVERNRGNGFWCQWRANLDLVVLAAATVVV